MSDGMRISAVNPHCTDCGKELTSACWQVGMDAYCGNCYFKRYPPETRTPGPAVDVTSEWVRPAAAAEVARLQQQVNRLGDEVERLQEALKRASEMIAGKIDMTPAPIYVNLTPEQVEELKARIEAAKVAKS